MGQSMRAIANSAFLTVGMFLKYESWLEWRMAMNP
jgi:hypothetical protein